MKLIKRNLRLMVAIICVLMASLIGYGAYSLSVFGNRWFSSAANTRLRTAKKGVIPGRIYDRNGRLLAGVDENGQRTYQDDVLLRSALVHLVGDKDNNVAYGVESFMANYLYAFGDTYLDRLTTAFSGKARHGYDLRLTVDSKLTRLIANEFPKGKSGAVIVMNYQTGELLTLSSFPGFDPLNIPKDVNSDPAQPFWNRATRWLSAPGSTFKVVTMAAALMDDPAALEKTYSCTGAFQVGEVLITDAGQAVHGELDLNKALTVSCNITFAKLALELGDEKLKKASQAFGFDDYLLFSDLVVENASYPTSNRVSKELAWTGAGQSALSITPLHMCLIASGIANEGVMMEPKILLQAVDDERHTRAQIQPRAYKAPLSEEQAEIITKAMRSVVSNGTGTRAAVKGMQIAGKTGSAQVGNQTETNAWFIGFNQSAKWPYAVCVVVEDEGSGGRGAAPIAAKIFQFLKDHYTE